MHDLRTIMLRALAAALFALPTAANGAEVHLLEDGSPAKITSLGNEALMQGRYETAIELYRKALASDKTYFYALFNLALAYQQLNQLDDAKRWYEEARKVDGSNAQTLCNLGFLAFRRSDFKAGIELFEEAARLSVHQPLEAADYWYNAGSCREKLSQFNEARRAYEECLTRNDRHYGAHYNLGSLYLGPLGNTPTSLEQAEAQLTRARDCDPKRIEAWINLGICHERSGHGDPEAAFSKAVEVAAPSELNKAIWQRAQYYNRMRPPKRVLMRDDLVRVLATEPDFAQANGMLGSYYFSIADYENAIVHLEREVTGEHFDPNSSTDQEAHYILAVIYTDHRADPAKALSHATSYYQIHPDSAKIHELRRRSMRLGEVRAADVRTSEQPDDKKPAPADGKHVDGQHVDAAHTAPREH
jgi:tetratricopeptide (TPR) repeat protein